MTSLEGKGKTLVERVEEMKVEWKRMWRERLDDKVRAEGMAKEDYSSLSLERGTVIFATRDFKPLSFKQILEEQGIAEANRFVAPNPCVGGWGKFVKTQVFSIRSNSESYRNRRCFTQAEKKPQQLKKGGRGWLRV